MPDDQIENLRNLRRLATTFGSRADSDLLPFRNANSLTFRRLPTSAKSDVDVATTCTVLMALAATGRIEQVYKPRESILRAFRKTFQARWTSSGLPTPNAFTAALIIRTAGHLKTFCDARLKDWKYRKRWPKSQAQTLSSIFNYLVGECSTRLRLDESLRANPALGYWLLDGADLLGVDFSKGKLVPLASWAAEEFRLQVSAVSSRNDIRMDPVALAMACCIIERLRRIAGRNLDVSSDDELRTYLPSLRESLNGIRLLFREQKSSGIWDKYFPMFYYRKKDSPGGANYCFAFEMLEAILYEFRHLILSDKRITNGLWSACQWCDQNRLIYRLPDGAYCGWNSGQQVDSLQTGKPESWATATIHMFASALQEACSAEIQRLLLEKYRAQDPSEGGGIEWDTLVDCDVELQSGAEDTVKGLLDKNIVSKVPALDPALAAIPLRSRPWRKVELSDGRSALLFGPPGTSKTTIVRAMAAKIDWPYLEITPSHFLRAGLEKIYVESNSIFDDLMDLSGVVILFDEMDALVQRRSGAAVEQLDVTRQFLTTSMLPKLAKLHGNARVVFVMATNHRRQFDEAILRAGRFDLLICVGPPTWKQKAEKPDAWIKLKPKNPRLVARVCKRMAEIATGSPKVARALDLFTIGEMKELVEFLRSQIGLENFATNGDAKQFQRIVSEWAERSITLREGSDARTEYELYDKRASKVQR